jgi:hypothetical protein
MKLELHIIGSDNSGSETKSFIHSAPLNKQKEAADDK